MENEQTRECALARDLHPASPARGLEVGKLARSVKSKDVPEAEKLRPQGQDVSKEYASVNSWRILEYDRGHRLRCEKGKKKQFFKNTDLHPTYILRILDCH